MCLMVPRRVTKLIDGKAEMQDGRIVLLHLVKDVQVGDFLLVQANMAIEKVSARQVREMRELMGRKLAK